MVFIEGENKHSSEFGTHKAVSLSGFAFVSNGKEAELLYIME
jgi:hypothetical protein